MYPKKTFYNTYSKIKILFFLIRWDIVINLFWSACEKILNAKRLNKIQNEIMTVLIMTSWQIRKKFPLIRKKMMESYIRDKKISESKNICPLSNYYTGFSATIKAEVVLGWIFLRFSIPNPLLGDCNHDWGTGFFIFRETWIWIPRIVNFSDLGFSRFGFFKIRGFLFSVFLSNSRGICKIARVYIRHWEFFSGFFWDGDFSEMGYPTQKPLLLYKVFLQYKIFKYLI